MIATRPDDHARGLDVEDRLQERLRREAHHRVQLRRQQRARCLAQRRDHVLAHQRRRNAERVEPSARVGQQAPQLGRFVGRAIPDEIAAAVAGPQVVVAPGDRIADELLVRRQAEHHRLEHIGMDRRRQRALVHQAAPADVAGIGRLHLRQHVGAHIGAEAIGGDQKIALRRGAIGEMRNDAIAGLLDALQLLADVVVRVRELLPQHAEHAVPRRRGLRARIFAGERARSIERPAHGDLDAEIRARIAAGGAQHRAHFRMRHDAGAAPDQPDVDALIDVDLPAGAPQQDGRRTGRSWNHRSRGRGPVSMRCGPRHFVPMRSKREPSCGQCRKIMPKCRAVAGDVRLPLPASPDSIAANIQQALHGRLRRKSWTCATSTGVALLLARRPPPPRLPPDRRLLKTYIRRGR